MSPLKSGRLWRREGEKVGLMVSSENLLSFADQLWNVGLQSINSTFIQCPDGGIRLFWMGSEEQGIVPTTLGSTGGHALVFGNQFFVHSVNIDQGPLMC